MNLYETSREIQAIEWQMLEWAEAHDGDVTDFPLALELDSLTVSKDEKILSMALWYKNNLAEADAIDNEISKLSKRQDALERRAESLKNYIALCLGQGNKLNDPKVVISWKKSKAVKLLLADITKIPTQFQRVKTTTEADKVAIKQAIDSGEVLDFAMIEEKETINIK